MKHIQKRSRETKERILAAAKKLFRQEGYGKVSTERIATEANVAKGSVFAHFGDKTNLLAAIGSQEISQLLKASQETVPENTNVPLIDRMMQFYQPWLKFFLENPDFTRLYFSQSGLSRGPWTETFVQTCFEQENLIISIIEEAEFSPNNSAHTAKFYGRGAQAFFFQVVGYRISGWIDSDKEAEKILQNYLAVWLQSPVNDVITTNPAP